MKMDTLITLAATLNPSWNPLNEAPRPKSKSCASEFQSTCQPRLTAGLGLIGFWELVVYMGFNPKL